MLQQMQERHSLEDEIDDEQAEEYMTCVRRIHQDILDQAQQHSSNMYKTLTNKGSFQHFSIGWLPVLALNKKAI